MLYPEGTRVLLASGLTATLLTRTTYSTCDETTYNTKEGWTVHESDIIGEAPATVNDKLDFSDKLVGSVITAFLSLLIGFVFYGVFEKLGVFQAFALSLFVVAVFNLSMIVVLSRRRN